MVFLPVLEKRLQLHKTGYSGHFGQVLSLGLESWQIMAGESLLVVDENLVHSRLVAVLLESAGYHVQTASDSEQALEKIKTNRPRLVIMDIRVPLQGGLALVKRIKADPRTASTRVLMITPSIQTGEEKTVLEAGCDAYLSKPVDTRHLPTIIAELLSKEKT